MHVRMVAQCNSQIRKRSMIKFGTYVISYKNHLDLLLALTRRCFSCLKIKGVFRVLAFLSFIFWIHFFFFFFLNLSEAKCGKIHLLKENDLAESLNLLLKIIYRGFAEKKAIMHGLKFIFCIKFKNTI